jgi:hypothetical protein
VGKDNDRVGSADSNDKIEGGCAERRVECSGGVPARDEGWPLQAGFKAGYNDASHFTREYKKHFGRPPKQEFEHLIGDRV